MMNPKPLVLKPGDRSAALHVVGTKVTVLVSEADSASQQITLQSGDEGSGPPPHSHDWDESFYVTKGQVQFTCSDRTTMCPAGTLVHVPAGTVHAFSYGPGGGEILEVTGASSRAVQMFSALNREVVPGPPDVPEVIRVANKYGVRFDL
ncbi:cupin domain-containing protein [Synechococcus elongatus]|uniref:Cupin domain-containing protein n=1 Tax=Synechococcus elongatus PCC 11801 TaxID=2219813 RepID=A0AAN1QQW4_SYNEL|nr:cupin domain-containing protein [Synechococcus elongatus]